MNRQAVGVLLCALVLSTLGHEILNRHHLGHAARHLNGHEKKSHFSARSVGTTPDPCSTVVCQCQNDNGSGDLTIHINTTTEIIWILNATAHVAVVIDLSEGYIATFNESSGSAIIISLDTKNISIVNQTNTVDENFLLGIDSLCDWFDNGDKTTIRDVYNQIREVLAAVSGGTLDPRSPQETLAVIVHIGAEIRTLGPYLKFVSSGTIVIAITIQRLTEILVGLVGIFSVQPINQGLTQNGRTVDLQVIFGAQTSLTIVLYVLQLLQVDTIVAVFNSFTTSQSLFEFFSNTTGGNSVGVNGIVNIVSKILAFGNGKVTIFVVFEVLVEYLTSSQTHSFTKQWNEIINSFINLIVGLKIQHRVSFVYNLFLKIQKGTWEDCNIDVSSIISLLLEVKASDYLSVVFRIIYLLKAHISFQVGVVHFFFLLLILIHTGGLNAVVIITGIQVSSYWYTVNALYQIIQKLDFANPNLIQSFIQLPIISDIVAKFNAVLKSGGYKIDFRAALIANFSGIFDFLYQVVSNKSSSTGVTGGYNYTVIVNQTETFYETQTEVYSRYYTVTEVEKNKKGHGHGKHHSRKHV